MRDPGRGRPPRLLSDLGTALAEAGDAAQAFASAVRLLREHARVGAAALACLEPGSEAVELYREPGGAAGRVDPARLPWLGASVASRAPRPGPVSWPGGPRASHGLTLPLLHGDATVGAVALASSALLGADTEEEETLSAWASLLGAHLARLQERAASAALERAEREQEALVRFALDLSSDLDLRRAFPRAIAPLGELVGFDDAALLALDETGRALRVLAATREPVDLHIELERMNSASAVALARGETVVVPDTGTGSFAFDGLLLRLGYRSHLAHPLWRSGRRVGTLNLASRRPGGFAQVSSRLLEALGSTLAIAIENTLLFERVRDSEARYASLVESARDFIYRLDPQGRLVFGSRAGDVLLGRPVAELVGRPWLELLHPEDARPDLLAPLLEGKQDWLQLDLRLLAAPGHEVATSHGIHAIRDEAGALTGLQGVARDVTRERQAERAMKLHHELVEALDDYVFMADASGRLLSINRKARQALGWERGEVPEMTIWDLHPPDDKAKVERERWRIVETGASSFEVRLLARSGRTIPTRGRVTYSPESGTFQGVYRDVTEEQLMQDRLLQVEKLRALGEMASGVAHTFNNLLAVIGTTVQVARRLVKDEAVLRELEVIQQTVYDGGAAVRRIQDFTRKRPAELYRELDLDEVLREVARAAGQRARARGGAPVEIATDLGGLPPVRGSESELRDVFLNLAFNALDAMPDGGRLAVDSRVEGGKARVEVRDTGRGMTPEVRSRIFTPFFSTKGERGSGLGLAIALNVVSQHGGGIEVESEAGGGTAVRVLLPLASGGGAGAERRAVVLLVEGEPLLRMQLTRAVARGGHTVEAVSSAAEAIELLAGRRFDCVFASVGGGGGGEALAVADRARAGGARVVLLAGWGDEVSEELVREHRLDAVLRKPFPEESLLNLLHGLGGG